MLVRKSVVHTCLRSACVVTAPLLMHCAGPDESVDYLGEPRFSRAGSWGASAGNPGAGGAAPHAGGGRGPTAGTSGGTTVGSAGTLADGAGGSANGGRSATGGTSGSTGSGAGKGGASAGGAPVACSGKAGAIRGASNQRVNAAGIERTFVHYAPPTLDPNEPSPIVFVAHGWTMTGQQMFDLTQYHRLADEEGFIVMYPDGQPLSLGPWNVGTNACPSTLAVLPLAAGDDQSFLDAMIAFASEDQCVDRQHVFVTGFSMGGYFANETGCLRADIAAIGPHSGGSHDFGSCPVTRKPAILFHGTADGLIPAACGLEARDRWVELNGCGSEVDSVEVMGGHCEYSKDCPADGQVVLCQFDGMDHGWAGGDGTFGFPAYESATALSWAFFKEYGW
jgi:polyhydroxybutyrate depolymerase